MDSFNYCLTHPIWDRSQHVTVEGLVSTSRWRYWIWRIASIKKLLTTTLENRTLNFYCYGEFFRHSGKYQSDSRADLDLHYLHPLLTPNLPSKMLVLSNSPSSLENCSIALENISLTRGTSTSVIFILYSLRRLLFSPTRRRRCFRGVTSKLLDLYSPLKNLNPGSPSKNLDLAIKDYCNCLSMLPILRSISIDNHLMINIISSLETLNLKITKPLTPSKIDFNSGSTSTRCGTIDLNSSPSLKLELNLPSKG